MKLTEEAKMEIFRLQRAEKNGAISKELRKKVAEDICKRFGLFYFEDGIGGWGISEIALPYNKVLS